MNSLTAKTLVKGNSAKSQIKSSRIKNPQLSFLKKTSSAYGGELLRTRRGRLQGRPLDTKNTMHIVMRSSRAQGDLSFKKSKNEIKIKQILSKFSQKYGIKIVSFANVGNHLHLQVKLSNRLGYKSFIRATSAAIMMAVTGVSRWHQDSDKKKFWDYRPFTRVIESFLGFLNLKDYIKINQMEGFGYARGQARWIVKASWHNSA